MSIRRLGGNVLGVTTVRLCGQSEPLSSQNRCVNRGDHRGIRGEDRLRDPFGVEGLAVRITPTAAADDDRVDVRRAVEMVHAVRDGRRRLRPWTVASFTTMSTVGSCSWIAFWMSYRVSPRRDVTTPTRSGNAGGCCFCSSSNQPRSSSSLRSRSTAAAWSPSPTTITSHGLRSIFPPSTQ